MKSEHTLFPLPEQPVDKKTSIPCSAKPRLKSAVRNQIEFKIASLDELISPDHKARHVTGYVQQLDLSIILSKIKSVDNAVGRPATDPKILLSLWLYAVLEGILSARTIAEFCIEHNAYQWICGGVAINHHTLSDFATKHGEQFEDFLTQSVAILTKLGFVDLSKEAVAQDGMRVRANAGGASFRREKTLLELHKDAKEYLAELKKEQEQNPSISRTRKEAAKLRAAANREKLIRESVENLHKLREEKTENAEKYNKTLTEDEKINVRASTTDPEARIMKMACGGFRASYNVQFATTSDNKIIIAVDTSNQGCDAGLIEPMLLQIQLRCGCIPDNVLVDAGYVRHSTLDTMAANFPGCTLFMPVKVNARSTKDPHSPLRGDSKPVADWKKRMGTEEAKGKYKLRCATAEFSNAQARNKGLQQMPVRGIKKVKIVGHIFAVVHNMQRLFSLLKPRKSCVSV